MILDVGADWFTAVPSPRRDGEATYQAIAMRAGRSTIQYAHIDGAPELAQACNKHGIPFERSAPYVHETNGLIESINRVEIYGGCVRLFGWRPYLFLAVCSATFCLCPQYC